MNYELPWYPRWRLPYSWRPFILRITSHGGNCQNADSPKRYTIYEAFRFLSLARKGFRHRSHFLSMNLPWSSTFQFCHITSLSSQFFSSLHTSAHLFSPRLTFSPLVTFSQPLPPLRTSAPLFWFFLPAFLLNSSHLVSTCFTSLHLFSSLLNLLSSPPIFSIARFSSVPFSISPSWYFHLFSINIFSQHSLLNAEVLFLREILAKNKTKNC